MNKVAFKNLLIYFKQLVYDKRYSILEGTLTEYIAWLCYSIVHFKKDYHEYINQLKVCELYTKQKNYDLLITYLEDNIIYWDLACDEEDY